MMGHRPWTPTAPVYDVVVIGAGPAGSTAALRAQQLGLRAIVLEQTRHPRFHIGESFLPRNTTLIRELGLAERLAALPQTLKVGASFVFGDGKQLMDFRFADGLLPVNHETFNIERAPFDRMLCEAARDAGAEIHEDVSVRQILQLENGAAAVGVRAADGEEGIVRGRWLFDASGQATVVGRHLGTRRTLPDLKKVAYYGHFSGVFREPGIKAGYPRIVMCDEGWFWFIPLDERRTSIGLVMSAEASHRVGMPAKQMLFWGIERCPVARRWTDKAVFPSENWVTADFSYTCQPYAGPGHFLVGDAATFVDPIFSTGVCLGMMSAVRAADLAAAVLHGRLTARSAQRDYHRFVSGSSSVFFRIVRRFYRQAFRELFIQGVGPLAIHRAVISILAGNVFPKPHFSLRWRLRLFELLIAIQQYKPIAPRRDRFSLLAGPLSG